MEAGERWKRVQRESQCLQNFIIQHGTVGLLVERERGVVKLEGGDACGRSQFAHRE